MNFGFYGDFYCLTFLTQLYSQTGFRSIYLSFIKTAAISTLFALIAAVNVIIVIIIYIFTLFLWTWGEIYLNINYIIQEKERYITFECYCISNVL